MTHKKTNKKIGFYFKTIFATLTLFAILFSNANVALGQFRDRLTGRVVIQSDSPSSSLEADPDTVSTMGEELVTLSGINFDDNTYYQREVTLFNSNNYYLADYQFMMTVDTATLISQGKLDSNCNGIRVRDSDNIRQISHWVEEDTCNTSLTRIWFKKPWTLVGSNSVYLHYGNNPEVLSASNGNDVFLFFSDFNDGLTDWYPYDVTGTYTPGNYGNFSHFNNDVALANDNETQLRGYTFTENPYIGFVTETKFEAQSGYGNAIAGFRSATAGNGSYIFTFGQDLYIHNESIASPYFDVLASVIVPLGGYRIYRITTPPSSSTITVEILSEQRGVLNTFNRLYNGISSEYAFIGQDYWLSDTNVTPFDNRWDWYFVRSIAINDVYNTTAVSNEETSYTTKIFFDDIEQRDVAINDAQNTAVIKTTAHNPRHTYIGGVFPEIEIVDPLSGLPTHFNNVIRRQNPIITSVSKTVTEQSGGDTIFIYGDNFQDRIDMIPYDITLPGSTTLTNYPVMLKLDTTKFGGSLDCSSIAIFDGDRRTKLPTWVDGNCSDSEVLVWTKFELLEDDPGTPNIKRVYLGYDYGNSDFAFEDSLYEIFRPLASPSLQVWLRADQGISKTGSTITSWINQATGSALNAVGSPAHITSGPGTINGFPAVYFDASGDGFNINNPTILTGERGATTLAMFNPQSTVNQNLYYIGSGTNGAARLSMGKTGNVFLNGYVNGGTGIPVSGTWYSTSGTFSLTNGVYYLLTSTVNLYPGAFVAVYIDKALNNSANPLTGTNSFDLNASHATALGYFDNGSVKSSYLIGYLTETLLFDATLTDNIIFDAKDPRNPRQNVENYLETKYRKNILYTPPHASASATTHTHSIKVWVGKDDNDDQFYGGATEEKVEVPFDDITFVNGGELYFEMPAVNYTGDYDVIVQNHDGSEGTLQDAIRVATASAANSDISLSIPGGKSYIEADNIEQGFITVTARDNLNTALVGVSVTPSVSHHQINTTSVDCSDQTTEVEAITDSNGQVCFLVSSGRQDNYIFYASIGQDLTEQVSIFFDDTDKHFSADEYIFRNDDGDEVNATTRTQKNKPLENLDKYAEEPFRLRYRLKNNNNNITLNSSTVVLPIGEDNNRYNYPILVGNNVFVAEEGSASQSVINKYDTLTGTVTSHTSPVSYNINGEGFSNGLYVFWPARLSGNTVLAQFGLTPSGGSFSTFQPTSEFGGVPTPYVFFNPNEGTSGFVYGIHDNGKISKNDFTTLGSADSIITDLGSVVFWTAAYDEVNNYIYAVIWDQNDPSDENTYLVKFDLNVAANQPVVEVQRIILENNESTYFKGAVIDYDKEILYLTSKEKIYKISINPNRSIRKIATLTVDGIPAGHYFNRLATIDPINRTALFSYTTSQSASETVRLHLDTFTVEPSSDIDYPNQPINNGVFNPNTGAVYATMNAAALEVIPVTHQVQPQLEWTIKSADCDAIPDGNYGASQYFELFETTNITDGEPSTKEPLTLVANLLNPGGLVFHAGEAKDTGNQTDIIPMGSKEYTEVEFSLKPRSGVQNGTFCFRLKDPASGNLDTEYAEVSLRDIIVTETPPVAPIGAAPSTIVAEGGASDSYTIEFLEDGGNPAERQTTITIINNDTYTNGNDILTFTDNTSTPFTNNEFTLTEGDSQLIFVNASANDTTETSATQTIIHSASQYAPVSSVELTRTDLDISASNIAFNVTGEVNYSVPPASTFSFPSTENSTNVPNFTDTPITFTIDDSTGVLNDWILTAQMDYFSRNKATCTDEATCCPTPNDCIPLNRIHLTVSGFNNPTTSFTSEPGNTTDLVSFIPDYLLIDGVTTESLSDPSVFRNNSQFSNNPSGNPHLIDPNNTPAPITVLDTRNAPVAFNGATSIAINLMIDYLNIGPLFEGTYEVDLVLTLDDDSV